MIGLLILQLFIVKALPPPSQAEAIRILLISPGLSNAARWPAPRPPGGPRVSSTGATGPTLGPWDWPAPRPAVRLDGTPLSQPPTVYGIPNMWLGVPLWATPGGCQKCNQTDPGHKSPGR